jgi:methyl-accepting chemotaxis protein
MTMQVLLVVAVVLITLAVIIEAGALVAMYLMTRRIGLKAEAVIEDSRKLQQPLETIAGNLKTATNDLTETGKIARAQARQLQEFLIDTQQNVRTQVDAVLDTVEEARTVVMRPIRHYSALATGIAVGVRTFFRGKQTKDRTTLVKVEPPAA